MLFTIPVIALFVTIFIIGCFLARHIGLLRERVLLLEENAVLRQ